MTQDRAKRTRKMDNEKERLPVLRLTEKGRSSIEDVVAREFPLTIILNNEELVTLLCSPTNLKYLAIGFLFSEGLLKSKEKIKKIIVDNRSGVVRIETEEELAPNVLFKRLITSGCGRGASFYSAADAQNQAKVESKIELSIHEVFDLVANSNIALRFIELQVVFTVPPCVIQKASWFSARI